MIKPLTTLFAKEEPQGIMAAKGGRIGFRGGGQDASSDDFGGSTSSGSQDQQVEHQLVVYGGDSSGGTSANDMSGAGSNDMALIKVIQDLMLVLDIMEKK